MNLLKFIGNYFWNIIKSIGALAWTIVNSLLRRILLLVFHITRGPVFFVLAIIKSSKNTGWFKKGLLDILAWIGRIVSKIMDVFLVGELLDLIFQIIKPNSRTLTTTEKSEAQKVFGKGLPYWMIRIDEYSLIARLGAMFAGSKNMGVTTFHTINFTRKINANPGSGDMQWLIHELAHVSQMVDVGIQYLVEALVAQNTEGYNYGNVNDLEGKKLSEFNREQQAEIASDFYRDVLYGNISQDKFFSLIEELRSGRSRIFYS